MRSLRKYFLLVCLLVNLASGVVSAQEDRRTLFQVSTIGALLEGVFDGEVTFDEVKRHGDFGIGTLNGLDGEMVCLDGEYYQVRSDGKVYPVEGSAKTPFASVVFFHGGQSHHLAGELDYKNLQSRLDGLLPTQNLIYAIRIKGIFQHLKVRSVSKQRAPYLTLLEATKNQSVFELQNVSGTLVGFYFPGYMGALNVPGYHFHFISDDRKAGGHVLDGRAEGLSVEIEPVYKFQMQLSKNPLFYETALAAKKSPDLEKAEKG